MLRSMRKDAGMTLDLPGLDDLADAAFELFMKDGYDHTIKEIADASGMSESKARKLVNGNHGTIPGCTPREESRATYSRSYPGMQHGARNVWVYGPDRAALRDRLLEWWSSAP